jgi:hypothetical protein
MKKVKYLGGGWTDEVSSNILGRNVIIGNIYTVYRIDADGDYWFLDGNGFHTCMKPMFMEDVVETPEDNTLPKYFVMRYCSHNNKCTIIFKTHSYDDALDYREVYGGIITQVMS